MISLNSFKQVITDELRFFVIFSEAKLQMGRLGQAQTRKYKPKLARARNRFEVVNMSEKARKLRWYKTIRSNRLFFRTYF